MWSSEEVAHGPVPRVGARRRRPLAGGSSGKPVRTERSRGRTGRISYVPFTTAPKLGLGCLARIAKHTGLTPQDLQSLGVAVETIRTVEPRLVKGLS